MNEPRYNTQLMETLNEALALSIKKNEELKIAYDEVLGALDKLLTCHGFTLRENLKEAAAVLDKYRENK